MCVFVKVDFLRKEMNQRKTKYCLCYTLATTCQTIRTSNPPSDCTKQPPADRTK